MMFWRWRRFHATGADLSAFLDEQLDAARSQKLRAHLDSCPECRAALEELGTVRTMVAGLPLEAAPRSFQLTPEMAGAPGRVAPRRPSPLLLAPALSLSLLAIVLVVDLTGSPADGSADLALERGQTTAGAAAAVESLPAEADMTGEEAGPDESRQSDGPAAPVSPPENGAGSNAASGEPETPAPRDTELQATGAQAAEPPPEASDSQAGEMDEDRRDWLTLLEIALALTFVVSTGVAVWYRKGKAGLGT